MNLMSGTDTNSIFTILGMALLVAAIIYSVRFGK